MIVVIGVEGEEYINDFVDDKHFDVGRESVHNCEVVVILGEGGLNLVLEGPQLELGENIFEGDGLLVQEGPILGPLVTHPLAGTSYHKPILLGVQEWTYLLLRIRLHEAVGPNLLDFLLLVELGVLCVHSTVRYSSI